MNPYIPDRLKVFLGEESSAESWPTIPNGFEAVFQEFENLTGWRLGFCESPASSQRRAETGLPPGYAEGAIFVEDLSPTIGLSKKAIDRTASERLARSLTLILRELVETKLRLLAVDTGNLSVATLDSNGENELELKQPHDVSRSTAVPIVPQIPGINVLPTFEVSTP